MAMHKKLDVGSILFTYHEAKYREHSHRAGLKKYCITFKALYVHNRRERTSGAWVPSSLKPTLEKLSIRWSNSYYSQSNQIVAIGCRTLIYYECQSDLPYPSSEQIEKARNELESRLENNSLYNEGVGLMEIDFIEGFKEKKMSNKDGIFSLSKSLEDFVQSETYIC